MIATATASIAATADQVPAELQSNWDRYVSIGIKSGDGVFAHHIHAKGGSRNPTIPIPPVGPKFSALARRLAEESFDAALAHPPFPVSAWCGPVPTLKSVDLMFAATRLFESGQAVKIRTMLRAIRQVEAFYFVDHVERFVRTRQPATALSRRIRRHEKLLAALDEAVARHGLRLCDREWDGPEVSGRVRCLPEQHEDVRLASQAIGQSEVGVIQALLDLYPDVPVPTWRDWYHGTTPIIRHREGRRLLLVVPGQPTDAYMGESEPMDETDVTWFARLVIIDLD